MVIEVYHNGVGKSRNPAVVIKICYSCVDTVVYLCYNVSIDRGALTISIPMNRFRHGG